MNNCYWCNQPKPIIFFEYIKERHKKMELCWECLGELGFTKTQDTLLSKIKVCSSCKNKFLPKQTWGKICLGCWIKNKAVKQNDN